MRVLVTGDRNWSDHFLIAMVLRGFKSLSDEADELFCVIEGGAKGADRHAQQWAHRQDPEEVELITVEAEWGKYGNAAGPIRNMKMLDEHEPEFVLAFHNDLANSKGTKHCVEQAKKRGIPVYRFVSYQ